MTADVIARIDELAAEEKCPHCEREWHELALTQSVARMFESGHLDSNYFAREDLSPIVCDGANFIGPRRPEPAYGHTFGSVSIDISINMKPWIESITSWAESFALLNFGTVTFSPWLPGYPEPEPIECEPIPDIEVEFGPQNWLPSPEPVYLPAVVQTAVAQRLPAFKAIETHAPKKQDYDFSQFDWEPPTYPKGKKGKK